LVTTGERALILMKKHHLRRAGLVMRWVTAIFANGHSTSLLNQLLKLTQLGDFLPLRRRSK